MVLTDKRAEAEGFHGAIAGLSLPDVIQLSAANGFSGCISVQFGEQVGRVFFREGNLVHAEQGGKTGHDAVCDILEWKTGSFSLDPNVSTTSRTIHTSAQHVLMEAHRVIDERRSPPPAGPRPPPPGAPAARGKGAMATALDRLRAIPGVARAVVLSKSGLCLADDSPQGEALAAKAAYLAMVGTRLGEILRIGPLRSAAAHGAPHHCLLLACGSTTPACSWTPPPMSATPRRGVLSLGR